MRRLLRWLVNGLCLLSLLACVGVCWMRSEARRSGSAWVEVAVLHLDVEVYSSRATLYGSAVWRWPGGAGAWACDRRHDPHAVRERVSDAPPWLLWRRSLCGMEFEAGAIRTYRRPDGTPERPASMEREEELIGPLHSDPGWSGPLPYRDVDDVPHWLALGIFALPPLLWLTARSRRLYARRRRRRLGLCLRCGYDLTGNTSGRCSECGEPVVEERRVTA